ncbi:MAG: hypothetical protein ACYC96_03770 [Fimbriimonadaceae bacterium]
MVTTVRVAALFGLLAALVGCGGAGAGPGIGINAAPATNVRPNVTGDAFTYSVTGTYAQAPSNLIKPTTGTVVEAFQADTFNGQPALQDTVTSKLTLSNGQKTLIDTKQFASGGITVGQSDGGVMEAITAGGFVLPQTLSSATNTSATETLANGVTVTVLYAVTGSISITTAAGAFDCWTISRTVTFSDGFTSNDTIEFAPLLGAPVQEVVRNVYSDGFSDSLTTSLTAYSFGGT